MKGGLLRDAPVCRSVLRTLAGAAATMIVAGCTMVGPDFVTPKAPLAEKWHDADGAALSAKPAELVQWWTIFQDPALSRLVESAYRNNYSLKVAGLRVLQARAQLAIAVGSYYPQQQQASGGASYTSASRNAANTAGGDLNYWQYDVGANISWELDFWGKFRRAIESADANLLASMAAYDTALVLLTAQVADTYVAIRTAEEQLRVSRDNVVLQQRSFEIADVRYRNGDVDELDLQQARTQLLSTQATIPPLEISLQQARNALSTLLGQPAGTLAGILGAEAGTIPSPPTQIAAGVPADLLRRRPDVRRAELAAAAQNAQVGVAEAALYPSFGLGGFLGVVAADGTDTTRTGNSGAGQLFNSSSLAYGGGPFFVWDVLNYGRLRNNVRVQDAVLQQLLVNYQNTVLNAAQEVEDGMVAFVRSRQQEQILAANVDAAQRSLRLATVRYREGYSDFQRVLDAQTSLLAAQQRQVAARSTAVRSAIAVYRALGGGWEIRAGRDFVDPQTRDVMQKRTDWGNLLQPGAAEPPPADRGVWPSPDW